MPNPAVSRSVAEAREALMDAIIAYRLAPTSWSNQGRIHTAIDDLLSAHAQEATVTRVGSIDPKIYSDAFELAVRQLGEPPFNEGRRRAILQCLLIAFSQEAPQEIRRAFELGFRSTWDSDTRAWYLDTENYNITTEIDDAFKAAYLAAPPQEVK